MGALQKERWFYLILVTLVSASVFIGFAQTYLTKAQFFGTADALPAAVHVHGISFLLWYGVLVVQAALILGRSLRLHRSIGWATLALALAMVATGLLVIAVRMDGGLKGDQFWQAFGLVIHSNLILFAIFFGMAIVLRRRPDEHRRYMLLAAATGSGAAQFRSYVALFGQGFFAVPAGILMTNLFIVMAMIGELAIRGKVSRTYLVALPAAVLFEGAMFGLAFTSFGVEAQRLLVDGLRPLFVLY